MYQFLLFFFLHPKLFVFSRAQPGRASGGGGAGWAGCDGGGGSQLRHVAAPAPGCSHLETAPGRQAPQRPKATSAGYAEKYFLLMINLLFMIYL